MATQSRDVPSPASIPASIQDPELRATLEDVYKHLRGATLTTAGSTKKKQYRQVVNDDDRMEFQAWDGSEFSPRATLDNSGDLRSGVVVASPDGTEYRITVADDGTLSSEAV